MRMRQGLFRATRTSVSLLLPFLFLEVLSPGMASARGRDLAAGTVNTGVNSFSFAASADSTGANPKGHIVFSSVAFDVVCVVVAGDSAVVGGTALIEGSVGTLQLRVTDLGEPGAAIDTFACSFNHPSIGIAGCDGALAPASPCTVDGAAGAQQPIAQGNIQVHDAN